MKASPSKTDSLSQTQSNTVSRKAESEKSRVGAAKSRSRYPLYPSVIQLLHQNGLDASVAHDIPATGPNGRLLKGDVLAYIGAIDPKYPQEQSDRLANLSHLDLRNINRTTVRQPSQTTTRKEESPSQSMESKSTISLPISFAQVKEVQQRIHAALGIDIPLSTFISKAIEISNADLPRLNKSTSAEELFDQILGLDKVQSKHSSGRFRPQIVSMPPSATAHTPPAPIAKPDIVEVLAGTSPRNLTSIHPTPPSFIQNNQISLFSLDVAKADEARGRIFLEKVKTTLQIDPGRLVFCR